MARAKSKKKCEVCGVPVNGKGTFCEPCQTLKEPPAGTARRRLAEKVRDRLSSGETGGFICPYCRHELSWDNLGTSETEITIYVREKIYYCPNCRSFLGASSWHTEG